MKLITLFLSAIVILYSCNNNSSTKEISDTTTAIKSEPVALKVDRPTLIGELKRIKEVFSSKDRDKIATLFDFPIYDSTASFYVDDETYYKEWKKNGNKTTQEMFNRYFPQIYESNQMEDINYLFKHLQLDSLHQKDTLETDDYQNKQPCFKSYQIAIENETVTLTINMQSNREWVDPKPKEDEVSENSSEICEHALWWIFKFDGRKLKLFQISGAD